MMWSALREWTQPHAIVFNHREVPGPGSFCRERQDRDSGRLLRRRHRDAEENYALRRIRAETEGELAEVFVEGEQKPLLVLPAAENFAIWSPRRILMHPGNIMSRSSKRDNG
jgi:hypothetical protein